MASFSIVIPTHNRARTLLKAIESAKSAAREAEVIVVDDASSDETPSLCQAMDGIVFIRLDKNVGQAAARNTGILRSTGEFVAFLDDDDIRLRGSIEKQAVLLRENRALGFVYGQVLVGDAEQCHPTGETRPARCLAGDLFWNLLEGNFIYIASTLVRRQSLEKVGLFDEKIRGTEDWDLWIRLAELYPVGALEEPVAIYREFTSHSGQTSSNRPRMWKSTAYTLAKALESGRAQEANRERREALRADLRDSIWHNLILEGRNALSERRLRYAASCYASAIQINPKRALRPAAVANFFRDLITQ